MMKAFSPERGLGMTKERYEAMIGYFRGPHQRAWVLCFRNAPYLLAFMYAGLCLYAMFAAPAIAVRVIGVPAAVFVLATVLRTAINRTRPYDALGFKPLLPHKPGKGKSLPSRHAASAVVIACALTYAWPPLGIVAIPIAAFVCIARVVTGMHYPSDVLCAAALALLCAWVGFGG